MGSQDRELIYELIVDDFKYERIVPFSVSKKEVVPLDDVLTPLKDVGVGYTDNVSGLSREVNQFIKLIESNMKFYMGIFEKVGSNSLNPQKESVDGKKIIYKVEGEPRFTFHLNTDAMTDEKKGILMEAGVSEGDVDEYVKVTTDLYESAAKVADLFESLYNPDIVSSYKSYLKSKG